MIKRTRQNKENKTEYRGQNRIKRTKQNREDIDRIKRNRHDKEENTE